MEGAHQQLAGGASSHQRLGALTHFQGGLVRKSDGRDLRWCQVGAFARLKQTGYFLGDDPGFARTRPGQHQARPV